MGAVADLDAAVFRQLHVRLAVDQHQRVTAVGVPLKQRDDLAAVALGQAGEDDGRLFTVRPRGRRPVLLPIFVTLVGRYGHDRTSSACARPHCSLPSSNAHIGKQ